MSSNCPVCNHETNPFDPAQCINCGWDLTEFSEAFHIPESFEAKLMSAIESARNGWKLVQDQAIELQRLQEENAKQASELKWHQFAATAEQRWQELDEGAEQEGQKTPATAEDFSLNWLVEDVA